MATSAEISQQEAPFLLKRCKKKKQTNKQTTEKQFFSFLKSDQWKLLSSDFLSSGQLGLIRININPNDYYNTVIDYYNLLLRFEPCLNQLGLILILCKININPININPNTNLKTLILHKIHINST